MIGTVRFCYAFSQIIGIIAVTIPPSIYKQPDYNVYYKVGETVEMPCEATGIPKPGYTWQRNGRTFEPSGNDNRVVQLPTVGTLVITKPEDKDEGIFQCNASNTYGVSMSIRINLRQAKLLNYEVEDDIILRPNLGEPLSLRCVPPESVPTATVYWVLKTIYGGKVAVDYNNRVTMDQDYRLWFTNVLPEDHQNGGAYACMSYNPKMRRDVQGGQYFINPVNTSQVSRQVQYLWSTPYDHFGLRGQNFRAKCIFSGSPTPDVTWERTDGRPLPDRAKVRSFGQELMLEDLQLEDAGTYECSATNYLPQTKVQSTITVRVESRPYWLLEPEDQVHGVGGVAVFNCLGKSVPDPAYSWFVNGVPLADVKDDRIDSRFRRPRPDRIVFVDLRREDAMVIQCNASNVHGYIWGDAYLNVLSGAPAILKPPEELMIVAEGTEVMLVCEVTGKPDPIITWYKNGDQITGGHYQIQQSGNLYIKNVVFSDAGVFLCEAYNVFNKTSASGKLLVRRKTVIEQSPKDMEATAGYDAKFTCSGTTDPEEVQHLKIMWLKDNKEISPAVQRMTTNKQDNSLTISGTIVRDSGSYTCIATNGLDRSEATAMLLVKAKPDAANKVRIKKCTQYQATVVWTPGSYNNAPVQYFIVQYSTAFSPDTWTFATKVDAVHTSAVVDLSPWAAYRFRVIAYNKIGESEPSSPTVSRCITGDAVPDHSPFNLQTVGDRLGQLHIEWTPMPLIEQNGEGFQYKLEFWQEGYESDVISEPLDGMDDEFFHDVGASQVYVPYRISLLAVNGRGDAISGASTIRAFTGESVPTVRVTSPTAVRSDDISARIQWTFPYSQISTNSTSIRGEFRGFKIQLWERGEKSVSLQDWDVSSVDALALRVGDTFRATVPHLLPMTEYEATVAVMNNYYVAAPSVTFGFITVSGLPGPVINFRSNVVGDNHMTLVWGQPEETRGDLLGYDIGYQSVNGLDIGEMQERDPQITDPFATTVMLSGLLVKTKYRVHIWARTLKGRGEGNFIELVTKVGGDPVAPRYVISDIGRHSFNVSWWINPYASSGTVVYVEYRKRFAAEWLRTTDEVMSSWKNISYLEAGTTYEVRVIATNGGQRRASHVKDVKTGGIALAAALAGNWGWFLGMMLSFFLIIGLAFFFFIIFKRGIRFKDHHSPTNSFYAGDSSSYTGRYGDNKSDIPRRSADFGPESRGYNNDYYDDSYHDKDVSGGYVDDKQSERRSYYGDGYDPRDDRDYEDRRDYSHRDSDTGGLGYREGGGDWSAGHVYNSDDVSPRSHLLPASYSGVSEARRRIGSSDQLYGRQFSEGYDPSVGRHDYDEPNRFDSGGAPVDVQRAESHGSLAGARIAGAPSTFV